MQNSTVAAGLRRHGYTVEFPTNRLGLPVAWLTGALRGIRYGGHYDAVLLGDASLALSGVAIRRCWPEVPIAVVVHGLDVTYPLAIYQHVWVHWALPRLDRLIAVSHATLDELRSRGLPSARLTCIPNGVALPDVVPATDLYRRILPPAWHGRRLLLAIGRLVERKGVAWFLDAVMPSLPTDVVFAIAGEGPQRGTIASTIDKHHLAGRVRLLGNISDADKVALLNAANIFVQPNIPVDGDMEGFCIAVLEAALAGLPVVAARLEGLTEAVQDGENGYLVTPLSAHAFRERIEWLLGQPCDARRFGDLARRYTCEHNSWERAIERYAAELYILLGSAAHASSARTGA